MSDTMQSDVEQAAELDRLRGVVAEMELVLTALVHREGRIRLRKQDIDSAASARVRLVARPIEGGAVMLETVKPARSAPRPVDHAAPVVAAPGTSAH